MIRFNKAAFPKDYQGCFYVLQEFDKKRQVCPLLKIVIASMTCTEIYQSKLYVESLSIIQYKQKKSYGNPVRTE